MTKKQREMLKEIIQRFSFNNWTLNVISQHGYESVTETVSFYVHPTEYVEIAKEVIK